MNAPRRRSAVAGLAIVLVSWLTMGAQPEEQPARSPEKNRDENLTLPIGALRSRQLAAIQDAIAEHDWAAAIPHLQRLLGLGQDELVSVTRQGPEGKPVQILVSVRSEASRILAGLPGGGQEYYRKTYNGAAADLLEEARRHQDEEKYARIVREYLNTDAAIEALRLLAAQNYDAGRYHLAALYYEQLLPRWPLARWSPEQLFKATASFRQTGDKVTADFLARQLFTRIGTDGLHRGDKKLDLQEVQQELDRLAVSSSSDWHLFGGNVARGRQAEGSLPYLTPRWRQSYVNRQDSSMLTRTLHQAERILAQRGQPILPAFFPITATITKNEQQQNVLIYRSFASVQAVDIKTGKIVWESPSKYSLEGLLKAKTMPAVQQWLQLYVLQGQRPGIVFENSVLGSLSSDNWNVYAIEDLAIPPPAAIQKPGGNLGDSPEDVVRAIRHNCLQAFDAGTGRLRWQSPDPLAKDPPDESFFLGPPLPLDGKLYLLAEKRGELRLVCLDATKKGKEIGVVPLAVVRDPLAVDSVRRTQAAHLAYADGVLICPTNAGAIFGVELLTNRLLWAYPYREKVAMPKPAPLIQDRLEQPHTNPSWSYSWKITAPIIQDGKVIFTAPDVASIHCLNLRDGIPLWQRKQNEDDLYLAGAFAGKVLVVGKNKVSAYSLTKGEKSWELVTGTPSGIGIASGNVYYLPLKEMGPQKEPGIVALDLTKGQIVARAHSPKPADGSAPLLPGSLLFVDREVVSQSATEVAVFPQLQARISQIQGVLAQDAHDAAALTELGEMLREQGRLPEAIDALNKALKNITEKSPKQTRRLARSRLFEAIVELMRRDFARAEAYRETMTELCQVAPEDVASGQADDAAAETQRRRALYHLLVGLGCEAQGKLLEAFHAYLALAAAGAGEALLSAAEDPALQVRRDVWVRNRIEALLQRAMPAQRQQLETEIARQWQELQGVRDTDRLRGFVAIFGLTTEAGRAARFALVERLLQDQSYRAADLHLQELRRPGQDRVTAARAVEMLMKLAMAQELLEDALYYARILGRDFAQVTLRPGVTGADILKNLASDKRFLPYQEDTSALSRQRIQVKEERGNFPAPQALYVFRQAGEGLPFFQKHQIALQTVLHVLKLIDRGRGEELWSQGLTGTGIQNLIWGSAQNDTGNLPYLNVGHLVVLPVGHFVLALDPVGKTILWEKDLITPPGGKQLPGPPTPSNLFRDPRDHTIQVLYVDGWMQRLGYVLPINPTVVCVQTRAGLEGLDPITGRTLWTRSDVSMRNHLFTDGEYLFLVEVGEQDLARSTRVLRLSDGSPVRAPDFTEAFKNRVRPLGHSLLLSETGSDKALTLRLDDLLTGQNSWKHTFAAGAVLVQSEEPELTGAVEPDGVIRVYDLRERKKVFQAKIEPRSLEKVESIHLLTDDEGFFLVLNKPVDPVVQQHGGVPSNLLPGTGLRGLPAQGEIYAFEKRTGKLRWRNEVVNQMLILSHFREMPLLLCLARYLRPRVAGQERGSQVVAEVQALDKRTGKRVYFNEGVGDNTQYHTLEIDPRTGKIDLIGLRLKITFSDRERLQRSNP